MAESCANIHCGKSAASEVHLGSLDGYDYNAPALVLCRECAQRLQGGARHRLMVLFDRSPDPNEVA